MHLNRIIFALAMTTLLFSCADQASKDEKPSYDVYKPVIEGEWWSINSQPDLGEYTTEKQQPVDFGVWKAKDGTWQLWSCIRRTGIGGKGRLFFGWEGQSLTDTAWKPLGIMMVSDTTLGEEAGGLQAPHVIEEDGKYYMFYGDWNNICLATSDDGKTFTRYINENGTPALFTGPLYNTRDPMVLKVGDTYYCYYCGHNQQDDKSGGPQGAIYVRTSKDKIHWSEPIVVSRGGSAQKQSNWYAGDIECPFVVKIDNSYVLFRNQVYGANSLNTQYCSPDPLDFGDGHDQYQVGQLAVAAPEIVEENGQYYIVSLKPDYNGMKIARLKFEKQ